MRATIRFYAELNDQLYERNRQREIDVRIVDGTPVKEMIQRLGVSPEAVDLVLINGESVALEHAVSSGDRVSVFPVFESFDIAMVTRVREQPLRVVRFVLDVHLGKLASLLRMLGFDSLYRNTYHDVELLRISLSDNRTLLSKERGLLATPELLRAYCVREKDPKLQVIEVLERFDLFRCIDPFCRCLRCNSLLQSVDKKDILHRIPPRVEELFDEFTRCPGCNRLYWKGTHHQRMETLIRKVILAGRSGVTQKEGQNQFRG